MAATETPKASSSSSIPQWNYDVFLSFRGEDTRKNFTARLYSALVQAGIHTFRDENELHRGEVIESELLEAINQSRISLIILSSNYASSRWCLDELVEIMQCRKYARHTVLPIFCDVDPSDVRKQTGSFALARHEKVAVDKIGRWRTALTEVANLSGMHLQNGANGHEQDFIKKIVEEVLGKMNRKRLGIVQHLVGIDSRVDDMISLLNIGAPDVLFFGMYGMGGIGKTTIATVIHDRIYHQFECSSLLEDIRETTKQLSGTVQLQKKLLSDILHFKDIQISDVDGGINMIENRLRHKRVLLILDDVDNSDQVNALAREREWFGAGSRIIITTRNEDLLNEVGVDAKYAVPKLGLTESLELFSWHAFGKDLPIKDYVELSDAMVDHSGGLPLALKVLGSYLREKTKAEWNSALDKLKEFPFPNIQKILKISYEALDDEQLKDIFLDIACFFAGMDKDDVIRTLDGCGFYSEIGICELRNRCLTTISKGNTLRMHDLLRDMGRGIVREESSKEPGKRSRLWFHKDAHDVLTEHEGSGAVEVLILNLPESKAVHLNGEAFSKMHRLRLLQLEHVRLTKGYEHISKNLRLLCWNGFQLKSIPNKLYMENLVVIDMSYSAMKRLWHGKKVLKMLKVLDLTHCHNLTRTPDFSGLISLEKLWLRDCTSLVMVHQSIGDLHRLSLLDMENCKSLRKLPTSFLKLKSLRHFDLSGCSNLHKSLGRFSFSGYEGVESKMPLLSRIMYWVSLRKCPRSNYQLAAHLLCFNSLKILFLKDCNLSDGEMPNNLESLPSLEYLDLRGNAFQYLPASISRLSKLECLVLDQCTRLRSLPDPPPSLKLLTAEHCTTLERISDICNLQIAPTLCLQDNSQQVPLEIQGLYKFESVRLINKDWLDSRPDLVRNTSKSLYLRELLLASRIFREQNMTLFEISKALELQLACSNQITPATHAKTSDKNKGLDSRVDSTSYSVSVHVPPPFSSEIQGLIVWQTYVANAIDINTISATGNMAGCHDKARWPATTLYIPATVQQIRNYYMMVSLGDWYQVVDSVKIDNGLISVKLLTSAGTS